MKKIGVIANPKRPHSADIFERLEKKAAELNLELYADEQTAALLPNGRVLAFDQFASTVDALLAMGGDGTVLFCAKLLDGADVPILGINLGSLGFLTGLGEDALETALTALAQESLKKSIRSVVDCSVTRAGKPEKSFRILNDAVIGFGGSSHITTLQLSVDGEPITEFTCDGIIISTPTGSTGHALSAGGPILHPEARTFSICVICPHTLSNRPLVLPDDHTVEITIQTARKKLILSTDGQDIGELSQGDRIRITRSEQPVTFLQLPDYSYFSVLRQKLHWRGSNF